MKKRRRWEKDKRIIDLKRNKTNVEMRFLLFVAKRKKLVSVVIIAKKASFKCKTKTVTFGLFWPFFSASLG